MVSTTAKMSAKGKELLDALVEYLVEHNHAVDVHDISAPDNWSDYPLLWDGYASDRDGCIREGGYLFGDVADLEREIVSMFRCYFKSMLDLVCAELGVKDYEAQSTIEPSSEDTTLFTLTYKNTVLLKGAIKAWNFNWGTPEEMAEAMEDDYSTIRNNMTAVLIKNSASSAPKEGEVSGKDIVKVFTYFDHICVITAKSGVDGYPTYRIDLDSLLHLLEQQNFTVEKKRVHSYLHIV